MSDTDVMRKMLEQIKAEGLVDVATLRLQFFNLCKGAANFTDFLNFLSEIGVIRLNLENRTIEIV